MEEFIAVVFGNEVWMGLVDFKSDKSQPEQDGMVPQNVMGGVDVIVRDMKRSSAILAPRTFRTPYDCAAPERISSPVYEEVEDERRVESDTSRNRTTHAIRTVKEFGCRNMSPPDPWASQENREKGVTLKGEKNVAKGEGMEKKDVEEGSKMDELSDTKCVLKERDVRRENKKGQSLPISALHGYKYAIQQPKSILKRTELTQLPQQQSATTSTTTTATSPKLSQREISFVKAARQHMDRQKGNPHNCISDDSHLSRRTLESNLERTKNSS